MDAAFAVTFVPRDDVLAPVAVVAQEHVARALAQRVLALDDERFGELRGAAGGSVMIVTGEADALPWVDGVTYLGRDLAAPRLLLPTTARPDIALDIFEGAIARHAAALPPPWAVLTKPPRIFSAAYPVVMSRVYIQKWLEAQP
jgi:hypothetical protein